MDWKIKFDQEMRLAAAARRRGNEGQARVCARRAAGQAVRAYFQHRGLPVGGSSAYDLLQDLLASPNVPEEARQAAGSLILRVDENFKLPQGLDLLREAERLAASLLPDSQTDLPAGITL